MNKTDAVKKTQNQIATIRETLSRSKGVIKQALPRHMDADRMLRVVMTSVQKTPDLLECSINSLIGSVIQSAQLGLEPDNVVGEAYLIPYKKRCQLIPGYKGLLKLARRSGDISSITADVVYKQDKYQFAKGLEEKLVHTPSQDPVERNDSDIVAFYCIVRLKDGGVQWDWMWKWEVDKIRKGSPAGKTGPWVAHYVEMGKKTVIRRTCKLLPYSIELSKAVALDELADAGIDQNLDAVIEIEATDVTDEQDKKLSKLDQVVEKEKTASQESKATKPKTQEKAQEKKEPAAESESKKPPEQGKLVEEEEQTPFD